MKSWKKFKLFRDVDGEDVFIQFVQAYTDDEAEEKYLRELLTIGWAQEEIDGIREQIWVESC